MGSPEAAMRVVGSTRKKRNRRRVALLTKQSRHVRGRSFAPLTYRNVSSPSTVSPSRPLRIEGRLVQQALQRCSTRQAILNSAYLVPQSDVHLIGSSEHTLGLPSGLYCTAYESVSICLRVCRRQLLHVPKW